MHLFRDIIETANGVPYTVPVTEEMSFEHIRGLGAYSEFTQKVLGRKRFWRIFIVIIVIMLSSQYI